MTEPGTVLEPVALEVKSSATYRLPTQNFWIDKVPEGLVLIHTVLAVIIGFASFWQLVTGPWELIAIVWLFRAASWIQGALTIVVALVALLPRRFETKEQEKASLSLSKNSEAYSEKITYVVMILAMGFMTIYGLMVAPVNPKTVTNFLKFQDYHVPIYVFMFVEIKLFSRLGPVFGSESNFLNLSRSYVPYDPLD